MNRSQQQFLELLRCGLWLRPVDEDLFSAGADWNTLISIAKGQAVLGVVAEAISAMPAHLQPPSDVMMRLRHFMVVNAKTHLRLNDALSKLYALFSEAGIPVVLLKGQGLAANYPNPSARQCGDIDLYLPRKCHGEIERISRQWADGGGSVATDKHLSFYYGGTKVDLHHTVASFHSSVDPAYQAWTAEKLEVDAFRTLEVNGIPVKLPPLEYDAIYILHHLWGHFISTGVGFRQICDWALFMHRYSSQLDREELRRCLDDFDFHPIWNLFSSFAVRFLGMDGSCFPLSEVVSEAKTDRLRKLVFHDGNFDRRKGRPKNYIYAKLKMGLLTSKYALLLLSFHPREVLGYYWGFLKKGVRHFFLDWRGK